MLTQLSLKNFKQFDTLKVGPFTKVHVITGANGLGKTSILWGIVLFCRGYNALHPHSQHAKVNLVSIGAVGDLADLLNYSMLAHASSYKHFLKNESSNAEVSAVVGGKSITCTLKCNGTLDIQPSPNEATDSKIRFCFMGSDTVWTSPLKEPSRSDVLTSSTPSIRSRYSALSEEHQAQLLNHLKSLFETQSIDDQGTSGLFIQETVDRKMEIAFCGTAYRKVFATFVLLYTLFETDGPTRLFLLEEPESMLYPALLQHFMALLLDDVKDQSVQLIITSNSDALRKLLKDENIFVLWNKPGSMTIKGQNMNQTGTDWMKDAVNLHLLGIRDRPMVICEGEEDVCFLTALAPFFGVDLTGYEIIPCVGKTTHIATVANAVRQRFPNQKIFVILDPDFCMKPQETDKAQELKSTDSVIFWDLPSIESYLFIYNATKAFANGENPLAFLLDPATAGDFADHYSAGFRTQNLQKVELPASEGEARTMKRVIEGQTVTLKVKKMVADAASMFSQWTEALAIAKSVQDSNKNPTFDELKKVARVVHGHTWVQDIAKSTTPDLTQSTDEDIARIFDGGIPVFDFLRENAPQSTASVKYVAQREI